MNTRAPFTLEQAQRIARAWLNSTAGGIIDAGYRGEIQVILWNLTNEEMKLSRGDRIAQMLLVPIATPAVAEVAKLSETVRGDKGFGSSGK